MERTWDLCCSHTRFVCARDVVEEPAECQWNSGFAFYLGHLRAHPHTLVIQPFFVWLSVATITARSGQWLVSVILLEPHKLKQPTLYARPCEYKKCRKSTRDGRFREHMSGEKDGEKKFREASTSVLFWTTCFGFSRNLSVTDDERTAPKLFNVSIFTFLAKTEGPLNQNTFKLVLQTLTGFECLRRSDALSNHTTDHTGKRCKTH